MYAVVTLKGSKDGQKKKHFWLLSASTSTKAFKLDRSIVTLTAQF
jgi:hypothetical protein